jgi:hypothetical protein
MIVKLLLLPHESHFVLVIPKRERNETIAPKVVNEVVKKASTLTANGDPR